MSGRFPVLEYHDDALDGCAGKTASGKAGEAAREGRSNRRNGGRYEIG